MLEQVEAVPEWVKLWLSLATAGAGIGLMSWANYAIERMEARDLRKQLAELAAGKRRLLAHCQALTNDLQRRLVGRRDVLEELKAVRDVHGGKVDPYTTGCRGEGSADVASE